MKAPKRKGFGARVIMRRPFQAACADFVYSMVRILLKGKITQRTCPMIMSRVRAAGGEIVIIIAAVMAVVAVVAHDEVFVITQREGCHAKAVIVALRGQIGFIQSLAVAVDDVGANLDYIAGNAHHALDEVLRAAGVQHAI